MSRETMEWLNTNTLIGFTDKRGTAWHYRQSAQGEESNHYPGAIPVGDVARRLFNFDVESTPLFVPDGHGGYVEVPGRVAQRRTDTGDVFGIFTENYQGHAYSEWLTGALSNIIRDSLAVGSAGLLKRGAQAWVSVEVPENIKTPEGVEFRPNLLACTSYDGTLATTFKRVVTNVVCDNTMAAGLSESGQVFKARHSRYSGLKLESAREALAIVEATGDAFAAEVANLCNVTVSDKEWNKFLDAHIPVPTDAANKRGVTVAESRRDAMALLWNKDPRVAPWTGTAYGVVQAVNTYAQHVSRVNKSKNGDGNRAERNMSAALAGKFDTLDSETVGTLAKVLAPASRKALASV